MFRKAQSETDCDQHVQWFLAWLPQKLPFTALLIFYFLPIFSQAFFLNSPSHAQTVTYTYDEATSTNGIGRLTSMSDTASGTTKLYYDSMGRINKTDRVIDTVTYTTQTGYDLAGRTKSVTYPDNDVVNYSYNGPLLQKVYKDASTTYVEYPVNTSNALGQPGTATFGNGVTTTYTYSNTSNVDCPQQNFRLCKVTTIKTAPPFQSIIYSYDTVGNISGITDSLPTGGPHTNQTQTFGYDRLNRLTSANGPYGAITYHYDKNGNMLCNSALGSTPTCDPTLQNYASNYTYGDPAHAHAVTSAAGVNYTYDANGNMTGRGTHVLAYDLESRLSSVTIGSTTTSFVYDGNGARVKKISGSTFIYIGKLFECVSPCKPSGVWTGTKHIFAGSVRIASKPITTTGEISYYHPDHLGSTSVVTDKNGANTAEFVYYPFGDPYIDNAGIHYKYTGQERDNETALYFYNARYYDSRTGRFISADRVVQSKRNPQFLNRYSYVMNNPMRLIDPSGQVATCGVWGISCGNSGDNNPCANWNCSSIPPRGSGRSNTGNLCPAGGCGEMNGTFRGVFGRWIPGQTYNARPRPVSVEEMRERERQRAERAFIEGQAGFNSQSQAGLNIPQPSIDPGSSNDFVNQPFTTALLPGSSPGAVPGGGRSSGVMLVDANGVVVSDASPSPPDSNYPGQGCWEGVCTGFGVNVDHYPGMIVVIVSNGNDSPMTVLVTSRLIQGDHPNVSLSGPVPVNDINGSPGGGTIPANSSLFIYVPPPSNPAYFQFNINNGAGFHLEQGHTPIDQNTYRPGR